MLQFFGWGSQCRMGQSGGREAAVTAREAASRAHPARGPITVDEGGHDVNLRGPPGLHAPSLDSLAGLVTVTRAPGLRPAAMRRGRMTRQTRILVCHGFLDPESNSLSFGAVAKKNL